MVDEIWSDTPPSRRPKIIGPDNDFDWRGAFPMRSWLIMMRGAFGESRLCTCVCQYCPPRTTSP
jgi:hypothetical protein